jgi:hypothetical protein
MYTGQGGALKVSKVSLVVIKETKIDNLYKLEGSTEVEFEVTYAFSCLWHQQQGHMSKKGLQVLINCKLLLDLDSLFQKFCMYYIFVSYYDGVKRCRVWDPNAHKIIINRDIVCMEQPKGFVQV